MLEYLSISKRNPEFPAYLNFQTLREIGIKHLQALSGQLWTDYNLHDPGVTMLEVLCYAVTDLGYRNSFDIQDLLALNPADPQQQENNFFTPDQILSCNPVTHLDLRKRLIDIPGVRNAWLEKLENPTSYEPAIYVDYAKSKLQFDPPAGQPSANTSAGQPTATTPRLHPRGLYAVYIDLDLAYRKNACGELYRPWSDVLDRVKAVLCDYRNLCEDTHAIFVLGEEEIALCSDIELEAGADAEDVLVAIYVRIQAFLSPRLRFYTLQELLAKGKSTADIFAGRPAVLHDDPYKSHGFIDTAELEALTPPAVIYSSDLYQEILKVPGVAAVRRLSLINYLNGLSQAQHPWHLHLTKGYRPELTVEFSQIKFFTGVFPIAINTGEVKRRYYEQQAAYIKAVAADSDLDLAVPRGSYYTLADHYSIHHDFPLTYGISADGLPDTASPLRKAQARQLKGYLVFFDQLLANYLAQLAQVRDLFSWEIDADKGASQASVTQTANRQQTYFTQGLSFPGSHDILGKGQEYLQAIQEDSETYRDRRSRFLDHLLGRFAESFADYAMLNYRMFQAHRDKAEHETTLIHNKAHFLQEYPTLSRDRFRAFNYGDDKAVWNTRNVCGFKQRVARLLGMEDVQRRDFCHYQVDREAGQFIFIVGCGIAGQSFTSEQTYGDRQTAETALDQFLLFALHADFYQRFSFRYFYHYGWEVEVSDAGEIVIAREASEFLSQSDRLAWLDFLIQALSWVAALPELNRVEGQGEEALGAPAAIALDQIITLVPLPSENLYTFQLAIPAHASPTGAVIQFQGVQRYFSPDSAQKAAIALLKQIANRQNYRPILWHRDRSAERETPTPSDETRFTHYGYGVIDHQGHVLATSPDRLPQADRDINLHRWFSHLQLNHTAFQFTVEPDDQGYCFALKPQTGEPALLQSCKSEATAVLAWQAAATCAENLRNRNRYVSAVSDAAGNLYDLGIADASGEVLAIAPTAADASATFQQLNTLDPFLRIEAAAATTTTTAGYGFRLVDRGGVTLLQSLQGFETEELARDHFYQTVLGVLFEPGAIEPTATQEGFGFRVLSRPGDRRSQAASSPRLYGSEAERDGAIEHLFLWVRTARLTVEVIPTPESTELERIPFWLIYILRWALVTKTAHLIADALTPPYSTYIGRVYDQNRQILLQEKQRHGTAEAAWVQGDVLMELAGMKVEFPPIGEPDSKHFRLIDPEGVDRGDQAHPQRPLPAPYGWELTNRRQDEILATQYYTSAAARQQGIEKLQQRINDEGFHVLEHILLRPQTTADHFLPICVNPDDAISQTGEPLRLAGQDPYSFWISVILPYWPERFLNIDFRRFVEQTLRLEAPAHVALKIAWLDVRQMREFEVAYHDWLAQLAVESCRGQACDRSGALNRLLAIIPQLRSVYPQGILYDSQTRAQTRTQARTAQTQPIILNQTALGTAND
jgi:hypothetical protein